MTNEDFLKTTESQKGTFGEILVKAELEKLGFTYYVPQTRGPHKFDFALYKGNRIVANGDVKAKARMNHYNCTGIDNSSYNTYLETIRRNNLPFLLAFVDEMLGKIYWQFLHVLEEPTSESKWPVGTPKAGIEYRTTLHYPEIFLTTGITYFQYEKMVHCRDLTNEEINYLKGKSTRTHPYLK